MKKRLTAAVLCAVCAVFAASCDKNKNDSAGTPRIGVAKVISHPSLDATEKGIVDELKERGLNVAYDFQNANGDMNTAASIATKFKTEKADVAVAIGTPVAVAIANAITDKPVIFTAITDPVSANLVETLDHGSNNVTGVVDTIPIREQITAFRELYPFKKLGFIYTGSESNGVSMAKTAREVCEETGVEFIPATITNTSEVKQAAESLVGRVDAFYVTTDNALISGVNSLIATAAAGKIPVFSGDMPAAMNGGMVYVLGYDYYKLGRATGSMIVDVLNGKKPEEIKIFSLTDPSDYYMMIDLDAARNLGWTVPEELIKKADYIYENGTARPKK